MAKDYSNTFNTREIAKRLIGSVVVPSFLEYSAQDVEQLQEPLDLAVAMFFNNLASFMGTVTGLSDLGIPGLGPWKKLSLAYRNRKHSDVFWLFTLSDGNSNALDNKARLKMRRIRLKKFSVKLFSKARDKIVSETLISKFLGIDGLKAFGGVDIKADDKTERIANAYFTDFMDLTPIRAAEAHGAIKTAETAIGASSYKRAYKRRKNNAAQDNPDWEAVKANFEIRLWTSLKTSDLANIEDKLLATGIISKRDHEKLMNQKQNRRPLIRPFMAYYSQILLPQIISSVLNTRFNIGPGGFNDIETTLGPTNTGRNRGFYKTKLRPGVSIRGGTKAIGSLISEELP